MFDSQPMKVFCKMCSSIKPYNRFAFILLIVITFTVVEMKSVKKSLPRYKRSYDEFESITDPDLLAKQYALVHQYGGVDILGDIRQHKSGKIDNSDFGQNIHFWYKDRIRPGEKARAVEELTNNAIKALVRLINQMM